MEDPKAHLSHNHDVADNAIDMTLAEHHPGPPNNSTNQQQRWSLLFLSTFIGMGIATFGVLAGGKVGFFLLREATCVASYAAVDIAVTAELSSQEVGRPSNSALQVRNTTWKQRGACWLAVWLLQGTANVLWKITIEQKDVGTVWQPVPIIFIIIYYFICLIGLNGMVMMQAHRDRRPSVMKYCVLTNSASGLAWVGDCSPYPIAAAIGRVLVILMQRLEHTVW